MTVCHVAKKMEMKGTQKEEEMSGRNAVVPYGLASATPHAGEGIFVISGHK